MHWARESSPQRYKDLEASNHELVLLNYVYSNEGRVEHSMVAYLLYLMFSDIFATDADPEARGRYTWFEFVGKGQSMINGELYKWRKEVNPDNLHIYISDRMPLLYNRALQHVKDRRENAATENLAKFYGQIEKTLNSYKSKLSNDVFQDGVIKQARYRFRRRGFIKELDSYESVLGVGNGLLMIGANPELVTGFHEYLVSKFTETNYVPYSPHNPCVQMLLAASRDVFPEPDMNEFMWYYASTWLSGRESDCIMLFLVGGGQNGKTSWVKRVHMALGMQYVKDLKMELITGPSEKSNEANAALMELKGLRGGYFDESGVRPRINVARFKAIVNPGYQSSRQLYGQQEHIMSTANLISLSNYEPEFPTNDHGTWRRVYFYRNKVKFCEKPKPNDPYEKKEDPRFIYEYTNNEFYREATLAILTEYYRKLTELYGGNIKKVPVPTIQAETAKFRNSQDTINRFITEMVVKSAETETVSLSELVMRYDEWYRQHISRTNPDEPRIVEDKLINSRLSALLSNIGGTLRLIGYRCKTRRDETLRQGEVPIGDEPVVERPAAPIPNDGDPADDINELLDAVLVN